jgi:hypothetical protein
LPERISFSKEGLHSVELSPVAYLSVIKPCLRWLVDGLSTRRPGFTTRSLYVGFMVDIVAVGQVVLQFCTTIIWGMNNRLVGGSSSET